MITSTYGNARDFSARFNQPGYTPWVGLREVAVPPTPEQLKAARTKELARQASARQTARRKAARVNKPLALCEPSGFAVHKAEIRRELAKTKPAISTN